jgi:uncharacterized membrane protein YkgB
MMIVSQRLWADKTLRVALFARFGPVIVPAWFGAMKFTRSESHGISPLIAKAYRYGCSRTRSTQPATKR